MSVPDPLGRDRLAAGAAIYKEPVYGQKPPPKPFYLQRRVIALAIAVALLASWVLHRTMSAAVDTPAAATSRVVELLLDQEYTELRAQLCRADRGKVEANDLETASRAGAALMQTLDRVQVERVVDVSLQGSFADVPAMQVSGLITAVTGASTTFRVVTVRERGGWRVCLSPGGYGLGALNLDVPVGNDLEGLE